MDPLRKLEESDAMLNDLYELYFPPRDEEMYHDLINWDEWTDPL